MPTLSERIGAPEGHPGMEPIAPREPIFTRPPMVMIPDSPLEPTWSPFMRTPLPPIFASNPDSMRQFYKGGRIPQKRIYSPRLGGY